MSPSWENLDDFLDADEFAVTAVVRFRDGGERAVTGIFDDPYMDAQAGEYRMDQSRPRLLCKEADLAGIEARDSATIGGKFYTILSAPQSTGDGMALLEMAETARRD